MKVVAKLNKKAPVIVEEVPVVSHIVSQNDAKYREAFRKHESIHPSEPNQAFILTDNLISVLDSAGVLIQDKDVVELQQQMDPHKVGKIFLEDFLAIMTAREEPDAPHVNPKPIFSKTPDTPLVGDQKRFNFAAVANAVANTIIEEAHEQPPPSNISMSVLARLMGMKATAKTNMAAVATLRTVPWLAAAQPHNLASLAKHARLSQFYPRTVLTREGDLLNVAFIIVQGTCRLSIKSTLDVPETAQIVQASAQRANSVHSLPAKKGKVTHRPQVLVGVVGKGEVIGGDIFLWHRPEDGKERAERTLRALHKEHGHELGEHALHFDEDTDDFGVHGELIPSAPTTSSGSHHPPTPSGRSNNPPTPSGRSTPKPLKNRHKSTSSLLLALAQDAVPSPEKLHKLLKHKKDKVKEEELVREQEKDKEKEHGGERNSGPVGYTFVGGQYTVSRSIQARMK
jgi:hypothetical protein